MALNPKKNIVWTPLSSWIGGKYDDKAVFERLFRERLAEFKKTATKTGGLAQSADADRFFADFQVFQDKDYRLNSDLEREILKYKAQYDLQRDPATIHAIFGGDYKEAGLRSGKWVDQGNGEYWWDLAYGYKEGQEVRSQALKNALGEEIFNLGLKDKNGEVIVPEKLIDFAEYKPLTNEEKKLSQSGIYNPLKNREEELQALATGAKKIETGSDTREMLKKAGKMSISGLGTALGSAGETSEMQSSFDRIANRAAAQNAMDERITQFKDKQDATTKLAKFKSEMLAEDTKRKQELMKQKSKTAVSFAGSELTAAEHAAQLAKANI